MQSLDSQARFDAFATTLAEVMAARSPRRIRRDLDLGCWIHGAGNYGRRIASLLRADGYAVIGFIDRRAGVTLTSVMGLPVLHPDAFLPEHANGRTFVGGVLNPDAASGDILDWVRALPFSGIVVGADLPDVFGEAAATCWLSTRAEIQKNLERLRAIFLKLADRTSESVYLDLLTYRLSGDTRHHPDADPSSQYLPPDLPSFEQAITFLDGGAYTGDTCEYLIKNGVKIDRYVAFEPDSASYEQLVRFISSGPIDDAVLFPCGLSDRYRIASFLKDQGPASRLVGGSVENTAIACLSIDESLPHLKPDFVKMDVEGSERMALEGMVKMIERRRPRLAISLYHKPEDLWELPEWVSRYYEKLYIRQHMRHGFETVLYALPD